MSDRRRPTPPLRATPGPPAIARFLLARLVPDDVVGDLDESWHWRQTRCGALRARIWYWRQALVWIRRAGDLRGLATPSPPETTPLRTTFEDARDAFRSLRRSPAFSLTCVGVLALGLSAGTTIFSLANWVLLRPVPGVQEPDRLVTLRMSDDEGGAIYSMPHPLVLELRGRVAALEQLAAYSFEEAHLASPGEFAPRPVELGVVTANFFDTLDMRMRLGRGFVAEEAARGGGDAAVAVISDRLWRDTFGADPEILQRELIVNGRSMRVVGVAAAGFLGPELPGSVDLWAPVAAHEIVYPIYGSGMLDDWRGGAWLNLVGRLAPGAGIEQVSEQVAAAEGGLTEQAPLLEHFDILPTAGLGMMQWSRERIVRMVTVMTAAVGFLLLITCANFGNLLLARGRRRQREMAIRAAVGAGRGRLVRQQLWASTTLAVGGAAVGLVASHWLVGLFRHARILTWVEVGEVQLDVRVAAFAFGSALVCGALFGVLPAIATTRGDAALAAGARMRGSGGRRLRSGLLVMQLAVSFALVVGTMLMAQTIGNLRSVQLGISPDAIAAFEVKPGLHGYQGDELDELYARLGQRIEAIPGVESVSLSQTQPFSRMRMATQVLPEGATEREAAVLLESNKVSTSFFATLGLRLLAGRLLEPTDNDAAVAPVAVLTQTAAERLYPDGSAVGRTIRNLHDEQKVTTIVGVVADVRLTDADSDFEPWMFRPFNADGLPHWAAVQVLSSRPTATLAPELRATMSAIDDTMPLFAVGSLRGLLEQRFSQPALLSRTGTLFAALALLLVAAGLYGVLSTAVAERRHEFGVRTALGATAPEVGRMILRSALGTAIPGALLGALLAFGAGRILERMLFGVSTLEPLAFGGAALLLVTVTLAASLLPARRASRLDPVAVLRED